MALYTAQIALESGGACEQFDGSAGLIAEIALALAPRSDAAQPPAVVGTIDRHWRVADGTCLSPTDFMDPVREIDAVDQRDSHLASLWLRLLGEPSRCDV